MKTLSIAAAALAAAGALAATSAFAAPPAAGAQVFARSCAMCHTTNVGGANKLGPNLAGISGRKAGSIPGFRYSPAMAKAGVTWNPKTLDTFLTKPSGMVPGNRMGFAGIKDPAQRAALVAYLASLSK